MVLWFLRAPFLHRLKANVTFSKQKMEVLIPNVLESKAALFRVKRNFGLAHVQYIS